MVNVRRAILAWVIAGCACHRAGATDRQSAPVHSAVPTPSAQAASAHSGPFASSAEDTPASGSNRVDGSAPLRFPFGPPSEVTRYTCPSMLAGGPFRSFLAAADTRVAYVDGDDLLALVNRSPTGALSPAYVPTDLVDLHDGRPRAPAECESAHACLRRDAAAGLQRMLDQMRADGVPAHVESAFRGFVTQCWVFAGWAQQAHAGFCEATEQSALPGHSQHQLGTTVDLFTAEWASRGPVFRDGFGCTHGGQWLDEKAWQFGFVVSYPINPDDRRDGSRCVTRRDRSVPIDPKTGYKHEPWHLRFVGMEAAARFHDAWLASNPGSPGEITLEQWLRGQRGLVGDAELPVCDGCHCGACATFAADGDRTPCRDSSLRLGPDGRVTAPSEEPGLVDARLEAQADGAVVVVARVRAPAHTPTQTPIATADGFTFSGDATFVALAPYADTKPRSYADLPGAWRLAIEPDPPLPSRWPWRASLARADLATTWNRANLVLPARAGDTDVRVRIVPPASTRRLRATLLRDGAEHDTRDLPMP
jgi:D-alanyl-D-alanine carboxypeptidase